jgi:hypothetical protein
MTSNLQPPDYSKILKEASGGRANLISIFDDSFAAALAVLLARFRKFFRNRHLDISIPRTFIVLVFVTVAWLMIVNSNNCKDCSTSANQAAKIEPYKNYDLIKDLGAFAGATITVLFAMTNMHREYHYKKREKASQYISDWRSFDNSSIRKTVNTLKSELFWDSILRGLIQVYLIFVIVLLRNTSEMQMELKCCSRFNRTFLKDSVAST